jgi:PAS domain-containing protein
MRSSDLPVSFENRVLAADGTWRWIAWTLSPEPSDERVIGVGRDVTRAKEAAEARQASEARLRTMFETSYQYQGLLALDGTVLEANATSLEGIKAGLEDVIGKPFWDTPWFAMTPGMPDTIRAAVLAVAGGETVRHEILVNLPSGWRSLISRCVRCVARAATLWPSYPRPLRSPAVARRRRHCASHRSSKQWAS